MPKLYLIWYMICLLLYSFAKKKKNELSTGIHMLAQAMYVLPTTLSLVYKCVPPIRFSFKEANLIASRACLNLLPNLTDAQIGHTHSESFFPFSSYEEKIVRKWVNDNPITSNSWKYLLITLCK